MKTSSLWYLYTLSYKDNVFYVGITKDPVTRFSQHTNSGNGVGTFEYMYWIIERGELAHLRINLISHTLNKDTACAAEEGLIRYLSSIGNKLCNSDYNKQENILITCCPPSAARIRKKLPPHIINVIHDYHQGILNCYKSLVKTKALYESKRN
jgi:predicted GIY-YIG superfamily endonuclease